MEKNDNFKEYLQRINYVMSPVEFINLSNDLHFGGCSYIVGQNTVSFSYNGQRYTVKLSLNKI